MGHCSICKSDNLKQVNSLRFGVWRELMQDAQNSVPSSPFVQLTRDSQNYPIMECCSCEHVQINTEIYTPAIFETLYFHSEQAEVIWHESLLNNYQPYQDMLAFTEDVLSGAKHIADFGCGTGALLSAFDFHFKSMQPPSPACLYGVDFNPRCSNDNVRYMSADLNDEAQVKACKIEQGYDLVCSSHVLEHVIDPVKYLRSIASTLNSKGHIFIEIPDFSQVIPPQLVGHTNLINLQHIQYFTAETFAKCVHEAGLHIVKSKQLITGYMPRLQALLRKADGPAKGNFESRLQQHSAAHVISAFFQQTKQKRVALVSLLQSKLARGETLGLWGIGADFYSMQQDIAAFEALCQSPMVTLFDYEHAGKHINGKYITASADIADFDGQVFMLPILAETRAKLHKVSANWPTDLIDPYTQDILDTQDIPVQACQICQNSQWRKITEFSLNASGAATNKRIMVEIGECEACKHTQVFTPFRELLANQNDFQSPCQASEDSLNFIAESLSQAESLGIFGDSGHLLSEILKKTSSAKVTYVDYKSDARLKSKKQADYLRCDLNNYRQLKQLSKQCTFDLISAAYILDQCFCPTLFLNALVSCLSPAGNIFIEVIDASPNNDALKFDPSLVLNGHQLHYFTLDSLNLIAQRAGLQLLAHNQIVSKGLPRLQMLLGKLETAPRLLPKLTQSASQSLRAWSE